LIFKCSDAQASDVKN